MRHMIFMDGEFTGLNADGTEFVSIAMVKEGGEELYIELEYEGEVNDWVKDNVLPHLDGNKISKEEAKKKILEFVGNEKPYFISYVNQFDWMGICGLFGVYDVPFYWIPLDLATMLFLRGITPEMTTTQNLAVKYGINLDKHRAHNALDDARLVREIYNKVL